MSLLENPHDLARLATLGMKKLQSKRNARMLLLGQYVGRFYGMEGMEKSKAIPLNMIYQAVTTLVPNLVFQNPKAMVNAEFLAYRQYADILGLAVDRVLSELDAAFMLRKLVTDSLFLAGFSKLGICSSSQFLYLDNQYHDTGQVYWDRIDADDMILDPAARCLEECRLIGNRFRAPKAMLKEQGIFTEQQINSLSNRYEDNLGPGPVSGIGGSAELMEEAEDLHDHGELVELFLPEEEVLVNMPWGGGEVAPEIMRVVDYEGPEEGPYDLLGYAFVPDNILPVAPSMIWYDLHVLGNRIARKAARQAERNKRMLVYTANAWEDAQDIIDTPDGDAVRVDDVNEVKELEYGGVTEDAYNYIEWCKSNFAEMAMNIDLLSGTSSDEATATQAQMLQQNTSVRLADMQQMVYRFVERGMRKIAYFLHTDPLIELPLIKRVQGVDTQVIYTPEMREGDWFNYNLTVKPYSMARQDPNAKLRRIMEFCGNVIPALTQAFMQLGPIFNLEGAINLVAREIGLDEKDELLNSPLLHQMLAQQQMLLENNIPIDPKVMRFMAGQPMVNPMLAGGMGGAGFRPEQPVPRAGMAGGITPQTENRQGMHAGDSEAQANARLMGEGRTRSQYAGVSL